MKTFTFIFLLTCSMSFFGQTKPSSKIKDLKNANLYFDTEDYFNAINTYKKVLAIDPNNETANLNTVISRIKLNQSTDSSITNLARLKKSTLPETQFYFGQINHLTSNFEEAIICYQKYKSIPIKLRTISDQDVDYYIGCSKNAIEFVNNPHRSIITNLGSNINTPFDDYVPLITPDDSILYFTSRRTGSSGNLKDIYGKYFEDVYISKKIKENEWSEAKNIGSPINTNTHDACVSLSFDGTQMIIYRSSQDQTTGDLYLCNTNKNGWTEPQKLGTEINTPFVETSACFSNDTSVIYFSSNKPGGYGGKDLYRIKKLPNGKWSLPMNLGEKINTNKDEDAPFLHPDGVTLYFSSKGHTTMGDYDIFKTTLNPETTQFNIPENLGYPINTVNSDRFFVLNANGTKGYYSSIKETSFGGSDIYIIDTRFGDNDLKVKHGKVMIGSEISKAKITLIDIESKQISGIFQANPQTGKFLLVMNPLKSYKLIVEETGCHTMVMDIEPLARELSENDSDLILNLTRKKQ